MLSVFLCAHLSFVYHLWRNVSSRPLPMFYLTCWGFLCVDRWVVVPVCSGYFLLIRYMVCKCFLPFWEMPWQDFSGCWVESRPERAKDGRGSPLPHYCSVLAKLCLTLCGPRDYSPPGFYPWDFPSKNTGLGCHFLFQGIFLTQGSNSCLLQLPHW